jgi:hypothetical protein
VIPDQVGIRCAVRVRLLRCQHGSDSRTSSQHQGQSEDIPILPTMEGYVEKISGVDMAERSSE